MQTYKVTISGHGAIRYYKPGTEEYHRIDGPAVEFADGYKFWWLNNKRHRVDGPAVEYANGDKEWWLNGERLTEDDWKQQVAEPTNSCAGKVVEIDGKKYRLSEVE